MIDKIITDIYTDWAKTNPDAILIEYTEACVNNIMLTYAKVHIKQLAKEPYTKVEKQDCAIYGMSWSLGLALHTLSTSCEGSKKHKALQKACDALRNEITNIVGE